MTIAFGKRIGRNVLLRLGKLLEQPQGYQTGLKKGINVSVPTNCVVINSDIGDYTYVGDRSIIAHSTIGKFCSIASEVHIGSGSHPISESISTHPIFYIKDINRGWNLVESNTKNEFKRTTIGSDVWIGAKVVIRDGINIGDGAIIGAGAIVVKDIEPYAIYGGVPAKYIRMRFNRQVILFLTNLRWWDKDIKWIRKNKALISDYDAFVKYFMNE